MYRYIGVEKDTPDFPRVWGEGKTHTEARLNCEIALREKLLGKIDKIYWVLLGTVGAVSLVLLERILGFF